MYLDFLTQMSDNQRIGTGAHTGVLSSKSIDMKKKSNLGSGSNPVIIKVHGVSYAASASDLWLRVELVGTDDAALTSNLISIATLVIPTIVEIAGKIYEITVPSHAPKRYFGLRYTQGNTANDCVVSASVTFAIQEAGIQKAFE